MSKNILICVGHGKGDKGGYDSGAVNPRLGTQEYLICREIAKSTVAQLQQYDCKVTLLNYDGKYNLRERIKYANDGKYDVVVEIHLNAHTVQSANGTEVYYYTGDKTGRNLSDCISKSISAKLGTAQRSNGVDDGGDKPTTYFGIVRETKGTAVLVEILFISNDFEVKKVATANGQAQAGQAIADGIIKAYGLTKKATSDKTYYQIVWQLQSPDIAVKVQACLKGAGSYAERNGNKVVSYSYSDKSRADDVCKAIELMLGIKGEVNLR